MNSSLKIILGIILGVLGLLACSVPTDTPLPTPTTIPSLGMGEWVQRDGLSLTVTQSEATHACPDGFGGKPAEGAKFIVANAAARNTDDNVIDMPSLYFELNGYQSSLGTTGTCHYTEKAFGNVCWQSSGKLYPGVTCEGWELFEVPESLDLRSATIRIKVDEVGTGTVDIAEWRLESK